MTSTKQSFTVETPGRGFVDVTAHIDEIVKKSRVSQGLATVFIHHTSASLLINENADPSVRRDLEAWFSRLVKDGDPLFQHTDEGEDDMSAHIRTALTHVSLGIPVENGRLDLGRWQAVYVWEHRKAPHQRRLSVVIAD